MSCSQAQSLHGYFDGELDAVRAAEFEAHLQACPACAQALAAQQRLRRVLGAADLYAKVPVPLRARVRAQLPPSPAAGTPRAARWRSLTAAASLVLVSFGLWRTVPVYAGRKQVINVFVWPSEKPDAALRSGVELGYTWIRWTRSGMRF